MKEPAYIYLVPPADPVVAEYADLWKQMEDPSNHTLNVQVSLDDVVKGNIGGVQEMLITLQHHPHLIEKMLFSFKFQFLTDDTEMIIEEDDWRADPIFYKWIQQLMVMPFAHYFIADEDLRAHSFINDLVDGEDVEIRKETETTNEAIGFSNEVGNIIIRRIYDSAVSLLMFCHNADFDPGIYIEGVMAWYDVPFTYDEVLAGYNEQLDHIREQLQNNAA